MNMRIYSQIKVMPSEGGKMQHEHCYHPVGYLKPVILHGKFSPTEGVKQAPEKVSVCCDCGWLVRMIVSMETGVLYPDERGEKIYPTEVYPLNSACLSVLCLIGGSGVAKP